MGAEVVTAYRNLYRNILRAVQYSKPARFLYRDRLRESFRTGKKADFDQSKIDNTILFLEAATHDTGVEHRVVKNLGRVWYAQGSSLERRANADTGEIPFKLNAYEHFNHTITLLNESLNMCIPTSYHWQYVKKPYQQKQTSIDNSPYITGPKGKTTLRSTAKHFGYDAD